MQCLPCPTLCFCFPAKVQAIMLQIGLHKWGAWYTEASCSHTDNILWNFRQSSPQIPPGICGSLTTQATEVTTEVIKGSCLSVSQCQEGVFLTSLLFECGSFCVGPWVKLKMANGCLHSWVESDRHCQQQAGSLVSVVLALISCFISTQGTNAETFSFHW